jgi:hypothetical protein
MEDEGLETQEEAEFVCGLQMTGIGEPMLHIQTPAMSGLLDGDGGVKFA